MFKNDETCHSLFLFSFMEYTENQMCIALYKIRATLMGPFRIRIMNTIMCNEALLHLQNCCAFSPWIFPTAYLDGPLLCPGKVNNLWPYNIHYKYYLWPLEVAQDRTGFTWRLVENFHRCHWGKWNFGGMQGSRSIRGGQHFSIFFSVFFFSIFYVFTSWDSEQAA